MHAPGHTPPYHEWTDEEVATLRSAFDASPYGETLRGNLRYARFKPTDLDSQEWERLLGADVNNNRHLLLTRYIARRFVERCMHDPFVREDPSSPAHFSQSETLTLEATSITHDWGEALEGDISFDQKTVEHERREEQALRHIVDSVLSSNELRHLRIPTQLLYTTIVKKDAPSELKNEKLASAFAAIETLGYMRTGVRAGLYGIGVLNKDGVTLDDTLQHHLRSLSGNVLGNQTHKLISDARHYPATRAFLLAHHETIDAIFGLLGSGMHQWTAPSGASDKQKFDRGQGMWHEWIDSAKRCAA